MSGVETNESSSGSELNDSMRRPISPSAVAENGIYGPGRKESELPTQTETSISDIHAPFPPFDTDALQEKIQNYYTTTYSEFQSTIQDLSHSVEQLGNLCLSVINRDVNKTYPDIRDMCEDIQKTHAAQEQFRVKLSEFLVMVQTQCKNLLSNLDHSSD